MNVYKLKAHHYFKIGAIFLFCINLKCMYKYFQNLLLGKKTLSKLTTAVMYVLLVVKLTLMGQKFFITTVIGPHISQVSLKV